MKYEMKVFISNPNTEKGMSSQVFFDLIAMFHHDEKQYGNGYYLDIENESGSFSNYYDLRYDMDFNPNDKIGYLTRWANSYWSGKNGAYKVDELIINNIDG